MNNGSFNLKNKAILAPMAEVTDAPFRQINKMYGAGLTYTQMVSAKGVIENQLDTLRYLAFNREEKPIGVQIVGKDPGLIGEAVSEIVRYNPDTIDLNSGCPVSKICKFDMGAQLLKNPNLLGKLIRRMADSSNGIPVSAKLRLGPSRSNVNVIDNAKICEDNGASFIIVHARSMTDRYADEPDWAWLKKIKEAVEIPVIGNGSIFSLDDYIKIMDSTGIDGVMIARGALGNPFLFNAIKKYSENGVSSPEPSTEEVFEVIHKHVKFNIAEYGEEEGILKIRRSLYWYLRRFDGIWEFIEGSKKIVKLDELNILLDQHKFNIDNNKYDRLDHSEIERLMRNRVNFWKIFEENEKTKVKLN